MDRYEDGDRGRGAGAADWHISPVRARMRNTKKRKKKKFNFF